MLDFLTAHGALIPFYRDVIRAAAVTIEASVLGFFIGLIIGVLLLVIRTSCGAPIKLLVRLYVSFMRGTPFLIQLLIAYYVIPSVFDISLSPLQAGVFALACNTSAYISEHLRGALTTIPKGQTGAACSLGMRSWQVWAYILVPQVFYRALPNLTSEFTILLKASSLLSIISVTELSTLARDTNLQTNLPLQVFITAAAVYFVILFCASSISRVIERRTAKVLPNVR